MRGARRSRGDGLQLTRVGLWFALLCLIVAVAAANTGNNGLYLAGAVMGGVFVVSQLLASANPRRLAVTLTPPAECFANSPATVDVSVASRRRWWPRAMLVVTVEPEDLDPPAPADRRQLSPWLLPRLAPREERRGTLELLLRRRGRRRLGAVRVSSLFPFGLFRKGVRYPVEAELLVYPEVFPPPASQPAQLGVSGDVPSRRPGWGHDLLALRDYRPGDDPRGIHWKQSARTGQLVYKVREREESRRLSIVFDNAVGELPDAASRRRFERLVSEAATAALDVLERGHEVELVTRDGHLPFAGGRFQRRRILENLALVEPRPLEPQRPMRGSDPGLPHLRLAMDVAPRRGG